MASTGSVYGLDSIKTERGQVMAIGRLKVGNNAVIEAQDLGLRRIVSVTLTPYGGDRFALVAGSIGSQSTKRYDRTMEWATGSIGSIGSLNSYLKVRTYKAQTFGSFTQKSAIASQGTKGLYIGTKPGSTTLSFFIHGGR